MQCLLVMFAAIASRPNFLKLILIFNQLNGSCILPRNNESFYERFAMLFFLDVICPSGAMSFPMMILIRLPICFSSIRF